MVDGWVVARTKPLRELWAAENLARQNFEYYLPRQLISIGLGRRGDFVPRPLFRGYIFIFMRGMWHAILHTYGISSLVRFGELPAILPSTEIEKMKALEVDGFVNLPKADKFSSTRFKAGDKVRVVDGPWSGNVGIHSGHTSKQREQILLECLGRKTTVLIAENLLELAA